MYLKIESGINIVLYKQLMHVIKSVDLGVYCFTIKTTNSQGSFSDRIVTFVCCCVLDIILTPFQICLLNYRTIFNQNWQKASFY